MWFVDLNYNCESDWLIELSDNKLSDNKLSVNNLASELVENSSILKPITIEEIVLYMIWCIKHELMFSKTTKLHEPVGQMQFVDVVLLEQFTSAYCTKFLEKSCYLLLIMYMKKHHSKSRQTKFWKRARAVCNLHQCFNFALVLHENAVVFSQSGARNFSCTLM